MANRHGEPLLASVASWAVLTASFGLSASTWIDLGVLAGFTSHLTIGQVTLRMAWLLPVAVDGYVVVGLVLWMADVPEKVARFAKRNTYGAAGIGITAQSAYHLLFTLSETDQGWRVVLAAVVGALPPAVAALAVHMRALIRRESGTTADVIAVDTPAVPLVRPSTIQPQPTMPAPADPTTIPAPIPAPVVPEPPVPSPAQVATRITPPAPAPGRPAPVPARTTPAPGPRLATQVPSRAPLTPPATDTPVTAPGAAQPSPVLVDPAQLDRARQIAGQYTLEHGTPITAGRLALRMKVSSEQAAALLSAITTTDPSVSTVNGQLVKAVR